WFGMMIRVSTYLVSSWIPCSAKRIRWMPSNWKGLVTTPTVRMPASRAARATTGARSEEHTSELQSRENLVCRLLLEKKKIPDRKRLYQPPRSADWNGPHQPWRRVWL